MSRYRDERDEDYYGGRMRDRDFEERYERGGPARGPGAGDYYADAPPPRREGRPARDYDERRRDYYRDRDYFSHDYENEAVGRRGERYDYERAGYDEDRRRETYEGERRPERRGEAYDERRGEGYEERRREAYDEREGRSLWEEGREYLRRRGRRRGVTARSHLRCRDIMTRDVTVATRATTLEEVARLMRDEDTGVIPVVDRNNTPIHTGTHAPAPAPASPDAPAAPQTSTPTGAAVAPPLPSPLPAEPVGQSPEARRINADIHGNGRLVGLITDRDIVVRALAEGRDARTTRAEEIMTADVHTAQPNDRVIEAIRKMGDKQVRRIPIVDRDGTLRGIISMADVALETDDDRELAEALEEISSGSSFWSKIFG